MLFRVAHEKGADNLAVVAVRSDILVMPDVFVTDENPARLIGDMAYDSDQLDYPMAVDYGIELIAPHRLSSGWRKRPKTQDGRVLSRYKRRWKVERLFAWLQNFRRIQVCYDYYARNFLGFVQLGCMVILLRRCL